METEVPSDEGLMAEDITVVGANMEGRGHVLKQEVPGQGRGVARSPNN